MPMRILFDLVGDLFRTFYGWRLTGISCAI
jgi:hypothetical protein